MEKQGRTVDPEVKIEIQKSNENLLAKIQEMMAQSNEELKRYFRELIDLTNKPIEKEVLRNTSSIEDHEKRIRDLESRQTIDEGRQGGRESAFDKTWVKITGVFTAAGAIGALIGYIINLT